MYFRAFLSPPVDIFSRLTGASYGPYSDALEQCIWNHVILFFSIFLLLLRYICIFCLCDPPFISSMMSYNVHDAKVRWHFPFFSFLSYMIHMLSQAARLISKALAENGPGLVELRKIDAAVDIATTLSRSRGVSYLPGGSNMLLNLGAGSA